MQLRFNFSPQNFTIRSTFLSLEERGLELKSWSQDHPVGWEPKSPNTQLSTLSSTWSHLTCQIKFFKRLTLFPHPAVSGHNVLRLEQSPGSPTIQPQQLTQKQKLRGSLPRLCKTSPRNNIPLRERRPSAAWRVAPKLKDQSHFQMRLKVAQGILPRCLNSAMEKVFKLHGSSDAYPFSKRGLLEIWVM